MEATLEIDHTIGTTPSLSLTRVVSSEGVPADSPSHGGDVAVYVFDINLLSLPIPFYSVLVSVLSLCPFQGYFIP